MSRLRFGALARCADGMLDARCMAGASHRCAPLHPPPREAPIRTLGVSLVAIAAVVASLTLVRNRSEERKHEDDHGHEPAYPAVPRDRNVDLDQLRSAGL